MKANDLLYVCLRRAEKRREAGEKHGEEEGDRLYVLCRLLTCPEIFYHYGLRLALRRVHHRQQCVVNYLHGQAGEVGFGVGGGAAVSKSNLEARPSARPKTRRLRGGIARRRLDKLPGLVLKRPVPTGLFCKRAGTIHCVYPINASTPHTRDWADSSLWFERVGYPLSLRHHDSLALPLQCHYPMAQRQWYHDALTSSVQSHCTITQVTAP